MFGFVHCCALQKCISHSTIFRQQHQFNKFLFSLTRGWEQNLGPSNLTSKFLIHEKLQLLVAFWPSGALWHPSLTRMDLAQQPRALHAHFDNFSKGRFLAGKITRGIFSVFTYTPYMLSSLFKSKLVLPEWHRETVYIKNGFTCNETHSQNLGV